MERNTEPAEEHILVLNLILREVSSPYGMTFLWGTFKFHFQHIPFINLLVTEIQGHHHILQEDFFNLKQLVALVVLVMARAEPRKYGFWLTLEVLLRTLRQTDCSDQRDKMYAISGLASDIRIQPVYGEKTVQQLY